jgi:hypothetical protein
MDSLLATFLIIVLVSLLMRAQQNHSFLVLMCLVTTVSVLLATVGGVEKPSSFKHLEWKERDKKMLI